MDDAVLVQVADSLQHLLDHSAGVLLRVHPLIQDAIKQLPTWDPAQARAQITHNHKSDITNKLAREYLN